MSGALMVPQLGFRIGPRDGTGQVYYAKQLVGSKRVHFGFGSRARICLNNVCYGS